MGASILSNSELLTYIQNFISAKNPTADVQPGSDLYDLILHGNSQVASKIFEELGKVEQLQSLFTTFGDDLDLVARNYSLVRKGATFSSGSVTLHTTTFSSDIIIPDKSIVSTKSTAGIEGITFEVVGDYEILVADRSAYLNALNGRYEITVPTASTVEGNLSNVNANTISVVQSAISEIEGCVNTTATTGGTDGETDIELQQRCALSWIVSSVGTRDGYIKIMLDRSEVSDAYPVGPFDIDSVRPSEGIDVYCITTSALASSEQTISYANDLFTVLTNQPAIDISILTNLTGGYTLIEDVAYNFNRQVDNPYANSSVADSTVARIDWISPWNNAVITGTGNDTFTMANSGAPADIQNTTTNIYNNSRVTFTSGANSGYTRTVTAFSYDIGNNVATFTTNAFPNSVGATDTFTVDTRPSFSDSVKIQYTYNSDIAALQDYIDQSERNVIGSNILVKNGHRGKLTLSIDIKIFSGYDFVTVRAKVENALIQYISTLKLSDDIQLSDLTIVMQTGQGTDYTIVEVDYVDVKTTIADSYIVRWDGLVDGFIDDVISIDNREYVTLDTLTIGQV